MHPDSGNDDNEAAQRLGSRVSTKNTSENVDVKSPLHKKRNCSLKQVEYDFESKASILLS